MRNLSFIRWIDGARTGILGLTAAAPAPAPGACANDTSVTTPAPYGKPASATPVVPAHAAVDGRRTPAPYATSLLNLPRDTGSSGGAGLWRTDAVCPAAPRTALVRGDSGGRFRLPAQGGTVPVPGTGGRLVPAGTALRGDRAPFPSPGRDIAGPVAAVLPISRLSKGNPVAGGEGFATGTGWAPKAAGGAGHAVGPRRPLHASAVLPAHEVRGTVPDLRAPQGPVPGRTD